MNTPAHCTSGWAGNVNGRLTQGIVQNNSIPLQNHRTSAGYRGSWLEGCRSNPQADRHSEHPAVCGSSWGWATLEGLLLFHVSMQSSACGMPLSLLLSLSLALPLFSLCSWERMHPTGSHYTFIYMTYWTLQMSRAARCCSCWWVAIFCLSYFRCLISLLQRKSWIFWKLIVLMLF